MHIRTIVLISLLLALTAIPAWGDRADMTPDAKAVGGTGSVAGVVQPLAQSMLEGRVELTRDGSYATERWVELDGSFEITGLEPGWYDAVYYDIGEIPLCYPVPVEVRSGSESRIVIAVPVSISGMSCLSMLAMSYQGYRDMAMWAFAEFGRSGLSEVGEDTIANRYGQCKEEDNNVRIEALSSKDRGMIEDLRNALADFESAYYGVTFYGGTAAAHFPARAYARREELIGEILYIYEWSSGDVHEDVEPIRDKIDDLGGLADDLEDSLLEYYEGSTDREGFLDAVDELRDAAGNLVDVTENLPDEVILLLGDYLKYVWQEG
jgi:NADH:ubiquinone oxidoreductase subunit